jgi:uncharacterized protein (TIGR03437 family)
VITIYGIGLGYVTPDAPFGSPPPAGTIATTLVTPQVTLGSTAMNVLFSGLEPDFAGLYQINVQMPATLPTGAEAALNLTDQGVVSSIQLALQ